MARGWHQVAVVVPAQPVQHRARRALELQHSSGLPISYFCGSSNPAAILPQSCGSWQAQVTPYERPLRRRCVAEPRLQAPTVFRSDHELMVSRHLLVKGVISLVCTVDSFNA